MRPKEKEGLWYEQIIFIYCQVMGCDRTWIDTLSEKNITSVCSDWSKYGKEVKESEVSCQQFFVWVEFYG